MSRNFGVLISGRGSNMEALLQAARRGALEANPAIVIANEPDAAGLEKARSLGVPTAVANHRDAATREAHDQTILDLLEQHNVELVCLAGYMRLLSPLLVRAFAGRIMNIHPSLLPSFPGLEGQRQALALGAKVSGCTVHFVDEELDHGPIIAQTCVEIREDDNAESLSARILEQEHRLYPRAVQLYFQDRLLIQGQRVVILPQPGG